MAELRIHWMTITDFFSSLGAPLTNQRWSWGAVRPSDGTVFLRVWQDEERKVGGAWFTKITFTEFFKSNPGNLGYLERLKHVDLLRAGARSGMVMCKARDVHASVRTVASFDRNDMFEGGRLVEIEGDCWLERAARRPVSNFRPKQGS
jgi:hypothetical protein